MSSILTLSNTRSHFLYRGETDMRKSFQSLCGIIRNELDKEVIRGDIFIFVNKRRSHLKLLLWEDGGFSMFYRKLEEGTFELPGFDHDQRSINISADELHFMLKGISLKQVRYRHRYQQPRA
jgi:transposase